MQGISEADIPFIHVIDTDGSPENTNVSLRIRRTLSPHLSIDKILAASYRLTVS